MSESEKNQPLVSVVIPHWRGADILLRGLQALHEHSYHPLEIVLVDNGCDDGSIAVARQQFGDLKIVTTGRNLGYAGGCNHGMRAAIGKYIVLFNNDAVPAPNWLAPMLALMEGDATIAACQPKIIALEARDTFDYAGACGGYLDFLGFPFCRGRIVATLEKDEGQYNGAVDIFWASGACCMLRASVLKETGLLDEDFFAHMEEIDLNWRMQCAGYRIVAAPAAVVYHQAGSTLSSISPQKTYLNHRNALVLLLKNDARRHLTAILPLRLLLEAIEFVHLLVTGKWRHALMVARAFFDVARRLPAIARSRRSMRPTQKISAAAMRTKFYRRSIVWDYFILGRKRFSDLPQNALPKIP